MKEGELKFNLLKPIPPTSTETGEAALSLEEAWKKESREGDPKLQFEVILDPHSSKFDLKRLQEIYKDCDIFIPENYPATDEIENFYQLVSNGMMAAAQFKNAAKSSRERGIEYRKGLISTIEGKGKIIQLIDIPESDPRVIKYQEVEEAAGIEMYEADNLEQKIAAIKKIITNLAQQNIDREDYMLRELPKRIRQILDRKNGPSKKDSVKVLIMLGLGHSGFHARLKEVRSGENVKRSSSHHRAQIGYLNEVSRMVELGAEIESVDQLLLARTVFEFDFSTQFAKSLERLAEHKSLPEIIAIMRNVIGSLSFEDIAQIYELVKAGKKFRDVVLAKAKDKGIKVAGL